MTRSPSVPTDATITLNGLRFHYREWGEKDAPALLLLHGIQGHAGQWDRFAPVMADRFHVLALDQRGHGQSEWAADYAQERMDEDIAAFGQALGLGRTSIIGQSMGGVNAYLYAARHPGAVERLVIGDIGPDVISSALARPNRGPAVIRLTAAQQAAFADIEEAVEVLRAGDSRQSAEDLRADVLGNLRQREDDRWVWRFDSTGLIRFLEQATPEDEQWSLLAKITCPTLLVRGAETATLRAETAARMMRTIPNCRFVEIPESGHGVPRDNPAAFIAAVRPFLLGETE